MRSRSIDIPLQIPPHCIRVENISSIGCPLYLLALSRDFRLKRALVLKQILDVSLDFLFPLLTPVKREHAWSIWILLLSSARRSSRPVVSRIAKVGDWLVPLGLPTPDLFFFDYSLLLLHTSYLVVFPLLELNHVSVELIICSRSYKIVYLRVKGAVLTFPDQLSLLVQFLFLRITSMTPHESVVSFLVHFDWLSFLLVWETLRWSDLAKLVIDFKRGDLPLPVLLQDLLWHYWYFALPCILLPL